MQISNAIRSIEVETVISDRPHVIATLQGAISRAEKLNLSGRKRDESILDFICGAACLARSFGNANAADWLTRLAHYVGPRGFHAAVVALQTLEQSEQSRAYPRAANH